MDAIFYDEPELEFGNGRHIDIRFGLVNHGALDAGTDLAPARIRLGVVGDQLAIDQFRKWVDKCRSGVEMKSTPLSTLFPPFPGFGNDKPLCDFVVSDQMSRAIPGREIRELATISSREEMVSKSVDRFLNDGFDLYQNTPCEIVICLPPPELLLPIDTGSERRLGPRSRRKLPSTDPHKTVWHDLLKARAMRMPVPVQMLRPATYGGKVHKYRQDGTSSRDIEDEASRAWNCFTGLYYKAGGVPWRLPRAASDLTTCYVGVSYFLDSSRQSVQTSVAQVFNQRGEGVVVRGGQALVRKEDKTVHMDADTASELLHNALALYRSEHRNLPAASFAIKAHISTMGKSKVFRESPTDSASINSICSQCESRR